MSETGFKLSDFNNIFTSADPARKTKCNSVYNLSLEKLSPFKNHPFKLYGGQRFDDMVESIKQSGVLVPVIVRPIDNFTYEILSGHNRVEASKAAGLETVPAIVREGISDEDALLIVTETNLRQRSFSDMSHSERAVTLSMHYEAIKKQGRRTDLISDIENMLDTYSSNDFKTSDPVAHKLKSRDIVGQEYSLSKDSVARYLRVNTLIQTHKDRLDLGELSIRAAVTLSYLTEDEQHIVDDALSSDNFKLDMKKADTLRYLSEKGRLTVETAGEIFLGKIKKPTRPAFKLKPKIVSKYFSPEQNPDEIEATIIEALDIYCSQRKS